MMDAEQLTLLASPGTGALAVSSATGPISADVPIITGADRLIIEMMQPAMHSWVPAAGNGRNVDDGLQDAQDALRPCCTPRQGRH